MLKLRQLQRQKREQAIQNGTVPTSRNVPVSACQLRLRKDLDSLDLPPCVSIDVSECESNSRLYISIIPDEGYYKGGRFKFCATFKDTYPIEPPKVTLMSKIFHPNIDLQGNVCLNILREDWSPVLDVQSILIGLLMLFLEPNATDPLNKAAADVLVANPDQFRRDVVASLRGCQVNGQWYDQVM
ncbi:LAQU0S02e06964g1_1 [Lachancea quebecensis]|uniref:NEDD8-conjugating enzyme UBC12 n=1 Tax=Lachancea quebecensis TaxID=1654605 RepID=A0A0N7ML31_9SACH|nr:LAQU0S02e06964g1_1 [Lachancea quebecensis]